MKMLALGKISQSEIDIMQKIWETQNPITANDIIEIFYEKEWKSQTVSTFLSRLVEKGYLKKSIKGKTNFYTAAITKEQYKNYETQNFIKSVHGGSIKSFIAAFVNETDVSEDELNELKEWLNNTDSQVK